MEENTVGTQGVSPQTFPNHIVSLHPRQSRPSTHDAQRYASVQQAITALAPEHPVHGLRPDAIASATAWFLKHFPGDVMFAVKTNPEPMVLQTAYAAGMRHFDVASLVEAEQVHSLFGDVTMHFMHPVKSREAIAKAYYYYGIRHFSLDSMQELQKILDVTEHADDLCLSVRVAVSNEAAAYRLAGKFGIAADEADALLLAVAEAAARVGICFHVGSQCMEPAAYGDACEAVTALLARSGVQLDMLDVGGGFPSIYPAKQPPAMMRYMEAITASITAMNLPKSCQILAEPGRALVAEAGSLLVRVELRKDSETCQALYINDGVYGSLFDAGEPAFIYPVKAYRLNAEATRSLAEDLAPFMFYGPTCDSVDAMPGPFMLPADIQEGDWIEIGQMGAYGATMRTKFNGFYSDALIELGDAPLLSMDME